MNFARKTALNPRFKEWFPLKKVGRRACQVSEYVEMKSRTDSRYFSPLFYYRRILNEHRTNYDVRTMGMTA